MFLLTGTACKTSGQKHEHGNSIGHLTTKTQHWRLNQVQAGGGGGRGPGEAGGDGCLYYFIISLWVKILTFIEMRVMNCTTMCIVHNVWHFGAAVHRSSDVIFPHFNDVETLFCFLEWLFGVKRAEFIMHDAAQLSASLSSYLWSEFSETWTQRWPNGSSPSAHRQ